MFNTILCAFSASSPLYFEKSTGGTITGFPGRGIVRDRRAVADGPRQHHTSQSIMDRPLHTSFRSFVVSGFPVVCSDTNSSSGSPYGLYVGGYSNDDTSNAPKYGLSYMNAYNDVGNSNTNIGGRLTKVLINAHSLLTVILAAAEASPSSLWMGSMEHACEKSATFPTGLVPKGNARAEEPGTGAI